MNNETALQLTNSLFFFFFFFPGVKACYVPPQTTEAPAETTAAPPQETTAAPPQETTAGNMETTSFFKK